MSEYQYYEFLAIDRPLSDEDKRWLRSLSTRAEITDTRFMNTYEWGDFKGDPRELMKRCFDAHVYVSNFGIQTLMIKLPPATIDHRAAKAYSGPLGVQFHPFKDGVILAFGIDADGTDEDFEWDDGTGWMASLAPLRGELLDGDWRSLYLAWLLNIQHGAVSKDACEPCVPPGLTTPSAACRALTEFLRVDPELVALAAEKSAPSVAGEVSEGELRAFVGGLAGRDRDELLLRLLMSDDGIEWRNVRRQIRERNSGGTRERSAGGARTAGELTGAWRLRVAQATRRAAEEAARERARVAEEKARARQAHLTQLATRAGAVWAEVEALIRSKQPRNYDRAVELLGDLREATGRGPKNGDTFASRLVRLREAHASKPTLMRRLDAAELR